MDKKNTFFGLLFLAAGFLVMFWQGSQISDLPSPTEPTAPEAAPAPGKAPSASASEEAAPEASEMLELMARDLDPEDAPAVPKEAAAPEAAPESIIAIANDFIEVEFTNRGGAIRRVNFLQTKRGGRDDYVFSRSICWNCHRANGSHSNF